MTCLSSIKFNMIATVVRNYRENVFDNNALGSYQEVYDDLTGEVHQVYIAADLIPKDGKQEVTISLPCFVTPAYTVKQDNTLKYGDRIVDTESLTMKIPSKYHVYATDRVTGIRNNLGDLIFEDDQTPNAVPAVYNVVGVLPVTDPFGRVIERQVALKKFNG